MQPAQRKQLMASLQLAALLAPRSKRVVTEVTQAFEAPKAYVTTHARRLALRGVTKVVPNLAWLALIDALDAAKVCVPIDWKTGPEDLQHALEQLGAPKRAAWAKLDDVDDRSTEELLELAGAELAQKGKALASLDTESDEYCLVLVANDDARALQAAAKAAGFRADVFDGSKLARATKARLEAARPAPIAAATPEWFSYGKGDLTLAIKVSPLAFDVDRSGPQVKVMELHTFPSEAQTSAAAKALVAQWKRDGLVELVGEAAKHRPEYKGTFIGEFPPDAQYFERREGKVRTVRAYAVRGSLFFWTTGLVGGAFGDLLRFETRASAAEATERFEASLAAEAMLKSKRLSLDEAKALFRP